MVNKPVYMTTNEFQSHMSTLHQWAPEVIQGLVKPLVKNYAEAVSSADWWKFCLDEVTDKLNETLQQKIELRKELEEARARIKELEAGTSSALERQAAIGLRAVLAIKCDWPPICHDYMPSEADFERQQLMRMVGEYGPFFIAETIKRTALSSPQNGSFAGIMWAIYECLTHALRGAQQAESSTS